MSKYEEKNKLDLTENQHKVTNRRLPDEFIAIVDQFLILIGLFASRNRITQMSSFFR